MKKDKKILFYKYSFVIFLISLLYKIQGYQIIFFDLKYRNFLENFLIKILNIKEFNYEEINLKNPNIFMKNLNETIDDYFRNESIINQCSKISNKLFENNKNINILIKKLFASEYVSFFEILMIAENYNRLGIQTKVYYFNDDFINFVLQKKNKKFFIKSNFTFLILFIALIANILKKILRIKNYFFRTINNNTVINRNLKNNFYKKKFIYFPHQGLVYGSNYEYIKDHYFSNDQNSKFHFSNFLFVEHTNIPEISIDFYKKNKISDVFFLNLNINISSYQLLKIFLKLFNIRHFSFFIIKRIVFSYSRYNSSKNFLLHFKNIEGIFIGYDFLFPIEISIAARKLNIKTFSSQERSNLIYEPEFKFIIDYYFFVSDITEQYITNNKKNFSYRKLIKLGSTRTENIYEEIKQNKNYNIFKKNLNNTQFICAVFDYHSEMDFSSNSKRRFNNWKINYEFYKLILELSDRYQNVLFIIKSKNYNYFKLDYFKNILEIMRQKKNLLFAKDFKDINAYKLISMSNFSICRYSSLCEEMNSISFPFLIVDETGLLNLTDYKLFMNIASNKYDVANWIDDIIKSNKIFNRSNIKIKKPEDFLIKKKLKNKIFKFLYGDS